MLSLQILTSRLNETVVLKHLFVFAIFFGLNAQANG